MGMFDHITCKYPLPDKEVQDEVFQTKSLERHMDNYTITKEGRLVLHKVRFELVPEKERPYYGTDDWEDSLFRMIGSMRRIPVADIDMHEHGTIKFYIMKTEWYTYEAKFTEGNLIEIKRI